MSTVDWNKAPKWASSHGIGGSNRRPVWFNTQAYQYVDDEHALSGSHVWYFRDAHGATIMADPVNVQHRLIVPTSLVTPRIAAHEFLERGVSHMRDRAVQRDSEAGERSMARCVAAFNAQEGTNLTEAQGWRFMIQLKYARAVNGVFVADDYEDLAAYAGLAGEAAQ